MLSDGHRMKILALLTLSLCCALPALAGDADSPRKDRTRRVRVPGWGVLTCHLDDANVVVSNMPQEAAISVGRGRSGNALAIGMGGSAIAIGGGQHTFQVAPHYRPYTIPVPVFDGALLPDYQEVRAQWQAWADEMVRNTYQAYGLNPPETEMPGKVHANNE